MAAHPKRPSYADMRTSELIRLAASHLGPTLAERQLAAELRVRAGWIEVARHDPGVSQERRLGVAAIEDGPTS